MKLKELEQKVQENQKLKESLDNEKELWKNKANNLKRNSATKKPELLSNFKNYPSPERKTHYVPTAKHSTFPLYIDKTINENNDNNIVKPSYENADNYLNNESNYNYISKNTPSKIENSPNQNAYSANKSAISDDNNSDYDDRNIRLTANKINNRKVIVSDINSDVEGLSQKYY